MYAQQLQSKVTIQELTEGQDEIGEPTQVWVDVASVWANIKYLSGLETIKADATTSVAKASIRVLKRSDVMPGMRVAYGAQRFNIQAVLPDEVTRIYMDLPCEVGANNG